MGYEEVTVSDDCLPVSFRVDGEHVFAEVLGVPDLYAVGHSADSALNRLGRKYWIRRQTLQIGDD